MDTTNKCRCCLDRARDRDLSATYILNGRGENYVNMIKECFDVDIILSTEDNGICEVCISRLRDACDFKTQVQTCQRHFTARANEELIKGSMVTVNIEMIGIEDIDTHLDTPVTEQCNSSGTTSSAKTETCSSTGDTQEINEDISNVYTCRMCEIKFFNSFSLARHNMMSHNNETACGKQEICKVNSGKQTNEITKGVISGKKLYECTYCDYKTVHNHHLILHIRKHTGEKPFKCKFCDYRSADSTSVRKHEAIHTGDKPYKCNVCDYRCINKAGLRVHERKHTGEKPFKCKYCDHTSAEKRGIVFHEKSRTGEKPFKCTFCDYRCAQRGDIKVHERIHTGEKPFKCNFCDYRSAQHNAMKVHERTHTGEKPYKCKYCDHTTAEKSNIKIHERKHTGEKPFKCTYCDYTCSGKCNMTIHERKHTGEKPYKCSVCDFRSASSRSVKLHEKATHSDRKQMRQDVDNYNRKAVVSEDSRTVIKR